MLKPEPSIEQSTISKYEHGNRRQTLDDGNITLNVPNGGGMNNLNLSGLHENNITVDMPAGISTKASARTGYHFYKNSTAVISGKNSVIRT